jgi:hypothetical protein
VKPYPQELREEALQLHALGLRPIQIARALGVSSNTILRWTDPEYYERNRLKALAYKRSIRGVCEICGGVTRCCRKTGGRALPSRICINCAREQTKARRYWTRKKVIEAIQEWERRRGHPPLSTEWISNVHDPDGYVFPARSNVYQSSSKRNSPFLKWADAIEAAGYPRPWVGHKSHGLPAAAKQRKQPPKPRNAQERRERAIAALRSALAKENNDGNRNREGNDHDRAGHRTSAQPGPRTKRA